MPDRQEARSAAEGRVERALTMLREHAASLDPESFVSEVIAALESPEHPAASSAGDVHISVRAV